MAIRGACAVLFLVCVSEIAASDIEAGSSLRESQIRETGEVCASGDSNRAALALRNLLGDLEVELSAKSSVLQIVRLNLAHAERALGRTTEAEALEKQALSVETASPEPHPELASALSAWLQDLLACHGQSCQQVENQTLEARLASPEPARRPNHDQSTSPSVESSSDGPPAEPGNSH